MISSTAQTPPDEERVRDAVRSEVRKIVATTPKRLAQRWAADAAVKIGGTVDRSIGRARRARRDEFGTQVKYERLAGSYTREFVENPVDLVYKNGRYDLVRRQEVVEERAAFLAVLIGELGARSVLEVGAGELTALVPLLQQSLVSPELAWALDLSWSRLHFGRELAESKGLSLGGYVAAGAAALPFNDNSFDVVFTHHCLEQSPAVLLPALKEMLRVSACWLILVEPSYHHSGMVQRLRMVRNGYVRNIGQTLRRLDATVVRECEAPLSLAFNRSWARVVRCGEGEDLGCPVLQCSRCSVTLETYSGGLICRSCSVFHPVIDQIPLLTTAISIRL